MEIDNDLYIDQIKNWRKPNQGKKYFTPNGIMVTMSHNTPNLLYYITFV